MKLYILSKPLIYTPVNDTDAWFQNNEKCYMSNPHSIGDILMPYSWYFCTRNVFHSLQVYINYTRNKSTRKRVFIFNVPLRRIWIYVFWYFEVSKNVLTAYRLIVCNRVYLENHLKRHVDIWYICRHLSKVSLTTISDINTTDIFFHDQLTPPEILFQRPL